MSARRVAGGDKRARMAAIQECHVAVVLSLGMRETVREFLNLAAIYANFPVRCAATPGLRTGRSIKPLRPKEVRASQSSALAARHSSPGQPCCNVPAPNSQFNGSTPTQFSFQAPISQFNINGNHLILLQALSRSKRQHDTALTRLPTQACRACHAGVLASREERVRVSKYEERDHSGCNAIRRIV